MMWIEIGKEQQQQAAPLIFTVYTTIAQLIGAAAANVISISLAQSNCGAIVKNCLKYTEHSHVESN